MIGQSLQLHTSCFVALPDFSVHIQRLNEKHSTQSCLSFQFFRMFFMRTSGLWRNASVHSNCNNKFEVYHCHASVFMIYIPIPSEGALVYYYYYYYYFIIILSQNLCVRYLIGERNNQKKILHQTLFFSSSVAEASKFFPTYSWRWCIF